MGSRTLLKAIVAAAGPGAPRFEEGRRRVLLWGHSGSFAGVDGLYQKGPKGLHWRAGTSFQSKTWVACHTWRTGRATFEIRRFQLCSSVQALAWMSMPELS